MTNNEPLRRQKLTMNPRARKITPRNATSNPNARYTIHRNIIKSKNTDVIHAHTTREREPTGDHIHT